MTYLIILLLLVVFGGGLFFLVFTKKQKERGLFSRGMNLTLFLVTLPQEAEKEKKISLEEYFKTAEQFFSSLSGIKERKAASRILIGQPFFGFEIAVHRVGEEISFYVASPRPIANLIEKQILGFWPKAQVTPISDYNIFNPEGYSAGTRVMLTKTTVFPLKSAQEFGVDPMTAITSVFTKLDREGEGAAIQILVRPSRRTLKKLSEKTIFWLQKGFQPEDAVKRAQGVGTGGASKNVTGILGSVVSGKPMEDQDYYQKNYPAPPLTSEQQNLISFISKKAGQPLFDVNIRILTSAATEDAAQRILGELQSSFDQFSSPALNQLKFKEVTGKKLKKLFYRFSFRIFEESEKMTLSSGELATIFHFPPSDLFTPHLKRLKASQAPPPSDLPREGLLIGKSVFRGEERNVLIQDDDRRRHFYVVGQTGTGKSVLLQEMIKQDIEAGKGVALVDPHGDFAEKILGLIPSSRAEDVVYFNPADTERPLGLNMLEYDPKYPEHKTFVVNELMEIFEKLYNLKTHGFGGPIFEQYMRNSMLLIMEDPESGSTLVEISRVLADVNFRKYKLSKCKNIVVRNFWEMEAEKAGGEASLANMVPYITSKMNVFIANDMVRPIISQQKTSFNIREIMDQGKILIVDLPKGKIGDINSYLLGMIIIGKILISAFSRADVPEEQRKDFYLYIDEFHNVATGTISSALAEARKYRLNMIFGHQYVGQLDEVTQKAIFGNVGSLLAFRVGTDDAKYLATSFAPSFNEDDLVNFDNYNAALRLLINGQTTKPFNIVTFPPSRGDARTAELIKKYSRVKYGRDRALVEANLYNRLRRKFGGV